MTSIKEMKKERKIALKQLWEQRKVTDKTMAVYCDGLEKEYMGGLPTYEYQIKPGQVKEHKQYWNTHPEYSQIISSVLSQKYTKTNITMIVYFRSY